MNITPERPFSSPQEEIQWLKSQLEAKTKEEYKEVQPSPEAVKEVLHEASELPPQSVGPYALSRDDTKKKSDDLQLEEHHEQIDELIAIAGEKGIISALKVARGLKNPHLLDDFHDRLIEEIFKEDTVTPFS